MVVDPEMQKPLKDNNDLERATTTTTTTTGTTTEVVSMQKKTGFDGLSFSDVGFRVLCLLAVQNCSKNLLMRYVMQDKPKFLTSAAVIAVGALKLVMSAMYIVCGEGKTPESIFVFLKKDWKTSLLLMVPAMAYTVQMMLEYVAMAHIDAALFAVVVQVKMLFTAVFAVIIMNRVLRKNEILSLCLLTLGVMCCNYKEVKFKDTSSTQWAETVIGLSATLGIATSSGFASVYTEKVIKSHKNKVRQSGGKVIDSFSLAYMQVQLASVSLVVIGIYASIKDYKAIMEHGLWQDFNTAAMISVVNSALGGLLVAVGTLLLLLLLLI